MIYNQTIPTISIGGSFIRKENKDLYFIAEAGTNFYEIADIEGITVLESAKKIITIFASINKDLGYNGINAIKFQIYDENMTASKKLAKDQYKYLKRHNLLDEDDYSELSEFCKKNNIDFLASFFCEESVEKYHSLVPAFKVASPDTTNISLLKKMSKYEKPIIISTGASSLSEIDEIVNVIGKNAILLHCIVDYNFNDPEKANLLSIRQMNRRYSDNIIGYSDHFHNSSLLTKAFLMGASVIEKHIIPFKYTSPIFKHLNDFSHSTDPLELKDFFDSIYNIKKVFGGYRSKNFISKQEENFNINARRSHFAKRDIKNGESIKKEDIILLRPLGTGIPANENIVYKVAKRDIIAGEQITKDMLIN
jgi:sialic acid synthase SpsE